MFFKNCRGKDQSYHCEWFFFCCSHIFKTQKDHGIYTTSKSFTFFLKLLEPKSLSIYNLLNLIIVFVFFTKRNQINGIHDYFCFEHWNIIFSVDKSRYFNMFLVKNPKVVHVSVFKIIMKWRVLVQCKNKWSVLREGCFT